MTPLDATIIRGRLADAYAACSTRADFLVIVLDALDQANAPYGEVSEVLNRWDRTAWAEAAQAWIDSEEP